MTGNHHDVSGSRAVRARSQAARVGGLQIREQRHFVAEMVERVLQFVRLGTFDGLAIPTPFDHLAHCPTSTPMIAGAATGSHHIFLRGSLLLTDQRLAGFDWRACAFAVAPYGLMLSPGSTTGTYSTTREHAHQSEQ